MKAQLQCTTVRGGSPGRIYWDSSISPHFIVDYGCQQISNYPQYSVVSSSVGQCDLVINNASLELAATYWCSDYVNSASADLTVVGELSYVQFIRHSHYHVSCGLKRVGWLLTRHIHTNVVAHPTHVEMCARF